MSAAGPAPEAETADIVVAGGGPAGSTTAALLAARGFRVVLLERERFPRPHVGESLLPASVPILESLGVREDLERRGFLKKWGATMVWGSDPEPWSWYFRETNGPYPHAYQVLRAEFDSVLLDNARRRGVDVRTEHRVLAPLLDEGEAVEGVRFARPDGTEVELHARMVVDATGQQALLASRFRHREWDPSFENMALHAYFAGGRQLPPPDENNIFIESFEHGWLWHIPLHTGEDSVGAVIDSRRGQAALREASPREVLLDLIKQAPHTARLLEGATLVSGPDVVKDWSYTSKQMTGPGYVQVGDAACFIDPLFSSGVHLALTSSLFAAAYVTTVLREPGLQREAAALYEGQYRRNYGYFHALARLFYSSNRSSEAYFWEARRLTSADEAVQPRSAFINLVAGHPPEGYERVVISRGLAPETFLGALDEREEERSGRRQYVEGLSAQGDAFARAVPRLADGVRVERGLVLGEGEFVRGHLLVSPARPEGQPIIRPIAELLSLVDGQRTVREITAKMRASLPRQHHAELERSVRLALQQYYADGFVDSL